MSKHITNDSVKQSGTQILLKNKIIYIYLYLYIEQNVTLSQQMHKCEINEVNQSSSGGWSWLTYSNTKAQL